MNKRSIVKDQLPIVVLTADTLINLVERITRLEAVVAKNHKDLSTELQETSEALWRDCIPEITDDGRLKFKTYNEAADPMDAIVVASISPQKD